MITPMVEKAGSGSVGPLAAIRLATRANHRTGRCDPGYDRPVEDTTLSRSQTPISLRALWRAGILDWTERWKSNSKGRRTNAYNIYHKQDPLNPKKDILLPRAPRPKEEKRATTKCPKKAQQEVCESLIHPVLVTSTPCMNDQYTLCESPVQGVLATGQEPVLKQEEVSVSQPGLEPGDGKGNSVQTISRNTEEGEVTTLTASTPVTFPANAGKQIPNTTAVSTPVREFIDQRKLKPDSRARIEEIKMAATNSTEQYEKLSPAGKLACDYFGFMDKPSKYSHPETQRQWAAKFQILLAKHTFVKLNGLIRFAWTVPNFWPVACRLSTTRHSGSDQSVNPVRQ